MTQTLPKPAVTDLRDKDTPSPGVPSETPSGNGAGSATTTRHGFGLRARILGVILLAKLPVTGFLLYGITSKHVVIEPPQAVLIFAIGILLAFAATAGTAWLVISLFVLRPTRTLTATARRLAAGDLSARAGYRGSGELGELARTIDEGSDAIERKTSQIESLNEQLAQRTRQLETSNEELEAFAYSVSHDLRAPLRGIGGFTRILIEEYATDLPEDAARYLNLIEDNTQQMGGLVDGLLAFSRLGRRAMHPQPVEPAALARQALDGLHPELEGRPMDIRIDETMPFFDADPILIQQVFANLLGNAIKYSRGRDPAIIEVGWHPTPEGTPAYFVRDNGHGFDNRYVHKLFGVFQRLHRAEEYEGSGIGLALVQRVVHRHGGRIWAEGELDRGATFSFTIEDAQGIEGEKDGA